MGLSTSGPGLCLLCCWISNSAGQWWHCVPPFPVLFFIQSVLCLPEWLIQRVCLITGAGSRPLLTYLTLHHCCRTRHNGHRKQTTSPCKNHQETLPGTCGCRPWAGTLPYTLPMYGKTTGSVRRQAENSKKLHRAPWSEECQRRGSWLPLQDTEKLLTKGVKGPTGQTLPTGGMGDDSTQGLNSLDPPKPNYFCCPLNIGRHLLWHVMLLNFLSLGSSKRIRKREKVTDLSLSYLMNLTDC